MTAVELGLWPELLHGAEEADRLHVGAAEASKPRRMPASIVGPWLSTERSILTVVGH